MRSKTSSKPGGGRLRKRRKLGSANKGFPNKFKIIRNRQAVAEKFSKITFHVELGKVHVYTKQGFTVVAYEILAADKAAGSLKVRAISPDPADKKQELELLIKDQQITVMGGKEQLPFILKKIDEAEFGKRKAAVPANRIGR